MNDIEQILPYSCHKGENYFLNSFNDFTIITRNKVININFNHEKASEHQKH